MVVTPVGRLVPAVSRVFTVCFVGEMGRRVRKDVGDVAYVGDAGGGPSGWSSKSGVSDLPSESLKLFSRGMARWRKQKRIAPCLEASAELERP
jgi:hypothetical protein